MTDGGVALPVTILTAFVDPYRSPVNTDAVENERAFGVCVLSFSPQLPSTVEIFYERTARVSLCMGEYTRSERSISGYYSGDSLTGCPSFNNVSRRSLCHLASSRLFSKNCEILTNTISIQV